MDFIIIISISLSFWFTSVNINSRMSSVTEFQPLIFDQEIQLIYIYLFYQIELCILSDDQRSLFGYRKLRIFFFKCTVQLRMYFNPTYLTLCVIKCLIYNMDTGVYISDYFQAYMYIVSEIHALCPTYRLYEPQLCMSRYIT